MSTVDVPKMDVPRLRVRSHRVGVIHPTKPAESVLVWSAVCACCNGWLNWASTFHESPAEAADAGRAHRASDECRYQTAPTETRAILEPCS